MRGPFGSPGFQGILEGVTRMGVLDWTWELKSLLMDVGMVSADIRRCGADSQSGRRAAWPRLGELPSSGHPVDGSAQVADEGGLCSSFHSAGFVS